MSEKETTTLLSQKERLRMFWVLFINELKKLMSKKKYVVFFIIGAVICAGNFGMKLLVNILASSNAFGSMNAFKLDLSTSLNMLSFLAEVFIPFVAFIAVSDLMGNEFQNGSIRALLMRPVSRTKIYFSKILAVFVLCAVSFLGLFAVTAILDSLSGDISGMELASSLAIYVIDMIPIFVTVLMGAFINSLSKNSGMAMFICIATYLVLKVGGIFIPSISGLLFTGYTKWHTLWLGTTLPFNVMLSKIMLVAGYAIVLGSGGYYIFSKTDF